MGRDQLTRREPAALVTFDDGYRDNFDVAVPILRAGNVPATFFIPTAFLDSPAAPLVGPRRLRDQADPGATAHTGAGSRMASAPPLVIDLDLTPRSAAIMTIIRAFLDETIADERWFLDQLADRAEVAVDAETMARALFTDWDQVRRLAGPERWPVHRLARAQPSTLAGLDDGFPAI